MNWLVVSNMFFPFHIWYVILPINFHSIIFQDDYCTTNQYVSSFFIIFQDGLNMLLHHQPDIYEYHH